MKYSRLLSSLMVISAIQITEASMPRAIANGNNFISDVDEARSQETPNWTFEPAYPVAQTQNSTPASKEPSQDNSLPKPELPKECPAAKQPQTITDSSKAEVKYPLFVKKIKVKGSTIFSENDYKELVRRLEGRTVSREELLKLPEFITVLYLNRGYINSRVLSEPKITDDGVIEFEVIEGHIGKIEVYGLRGVNLSYVCERVRLGIGIPLNSSELENQLRLLRSDPLFGNVEASLRAPDNDKDKKPGESTLVVRVKEANPFIASVTVDNYFPPVVGSERFGIELRDRNLTGMGDELAASYYRSFTGGAEVWDFIYRVPLNPMNGTLQLRAAPSRNRITQEPFDRLGVRGTQELYDINYRQPLVRSINEEFALSLSFTYQNGQTFILNDQPTPFLFGPNDEGITRTSVIKFSQDYMLRDIQGAWSLRSQFSLGTGLFDATVNEAPAPDGRFFAWLGQIQRIQRLSDDHLLLMQADLQLTPDSLLTTQQFIIGGGQSLRGYRENLRTGDNGFRFSIEDRFALFRNKAGYPVFQLAPYVDLGTVWNNGNNPNRTANQNFLLNTGLGILWDKPIGIEGLTLRFDYSIPVLDTSDRGNNIQDTALYFSVRYQP